MNVSKVASSLLALGILFGLSGCFKTIESATYAPFSWDFAEGGHANAYSPYTVQLVSTEGAPIEEASPETVLSDWSSWSSTERRLRFNGRSLLVRRQQSGFAFYHKDGTLYDRFLFYPNGNPCSLATLSSPQGDFLLEILEEQCAPPRRYALIVADNRLMFVYVHRFPGALQTAPRLVRNAAGELFVVTEGTPSAYKVEVGPRKSPDEAPAKPAENPYFWL